MLIMIEGSLVADEPLSELIASDRVRISLCAGSGGSGGSGGAEDVAGRLASVAGVSEVVSAGADPRDRRFSLWSVRCRRRCSWLVPTSF